MHVKHFIVILVKYIFHDNSYTTILSIELYTLLIKYIIMAIPRKYRSIVRNSLIAAAGIAPLGFFGALDAVAVGGCWATMFFAIRSEANSSFGDDPKRIAVAVATGIASYYIACKVATFAVFCIPGLGALVAVLAALGISACCNIYFTYKFAYAVIDLMDKPNFSDDNIIQAFLNIMKRLPTVDEVKEIAEIYQG